MWTCFPWSFFMLRSRLFQNLVNNRNLKLIQWDIRCKEIILFYLLKVESKVKRKLEFSRCSHFYQLLYCPSRTCLFFMFLLSLTFGFSLPSDMNFLEQFLSVSSKLLCSMNSSVPTYSDLSKFTWKPTILLFREVTSKIIQCL